MGYIFQNPDVILRLTWEHLFMTVVALAIATIGAKFGAGGLGTLLFDGIAQQRYDKIWAGAITVALLALALNWLLIAAENHFDTAKKIERAEKKQGRGNFRLKIED